MKKIVQFIRESKRELQKVAWPSKAEVWDSTKVVIASVILVSIFLGAVDIFFNHVMKYLMK